MANLLFLLSYILNVFSVIRFSVFKMRISIAGYYGMGEKMNHYSSEGN